MEGRKEKKVSKEERKKERKKEKSFAVLREGGGARPAHPSDAAEL